MTPPAGIVVVIAAHGRSDLLARTLASLTACDRPAAMTRVIVAENGGRSGAEAVASAAAPALGVEYLYNEQANKSAALNRALEGIHDSWIVFFDDDVRLEPTILQQYAQAIDGRRGGAYLGGPIRADYEEQPVSWIYLPYSVRGWSLSADEPCAPTTFFLGANWAAYSEDLRRQGGFDVNFGPGSASGARGQESNMQARLQRAGVGPEYLPAAVVWHHVPKERCTAAWSLRRAHQESVYEGSSFVETEPTPLLLGYPRWRVRRLIEHVLGVAFTSVWGTSASKYQARLTLQRTLGFLRGWRLARRRSMNEERSA